MDLPFSNQHDKEELKEEQEDKSDYKNILKEVIEFGSMKGNDSFTELVKNGYLVRADYDLQIASQLGNLGEAEYQPETITKKVEDKAFSGAIVDSNSYYTLNCRKFIQVLRNEELKKLVECKLDRQAGLILGTFLDDSKLTDKSHVFENSEVQSFSQIYAKLKALEEGYEGKLHHLISKLIIIL